MKTLRINNTEIEVNDYNRVLNFNTVEEIGFPIVESEKFLNTDGLNELRGAIYNFESDHLEFDGFNVEDNGDIYLSDYNADKASNEMSKN